jgi:putative transcriptional regulator
MRKRKKTTRVGRDLVEAFKQLAAYLRGEIKLHSYEAPDGPLQYGYYRPARAKRAGSKSKRKG